MQGNLLVNSAVLLVETPAAVLKYCIGVIPCTLVVMLHEQYIFPDAVLECSMRWVIYWQAF